MIQFTQGNLLEAETEALVNAVNTVAVMGKGIALQFKKKFPAMYREYERACAAGEVQLGKMHVVSVGGLAGGPRWIINFPTKGHWRSPSQMGDVESGLKDLVHVIHELQIKSISIPALGCGLGGLPWLEVRSKLENAFADVTATVLIFEPI
jgi:O-acetyl-ADP-ribose deacetylase (regulator of RNase III)